jgi:hypothetical protein
VPASVVVNQLYVEEVLGEGEADLPPDARAAAD